jgi:molecular chaperone DnaK
MDELTQVSHKLAEEIYKQANTGKQQQQQPGGGAGQAQGDSSESQDQSKKGKDDVIDAEFREEKK